ncbi:phosphatidate cytidylyltransferase [Sporosarcina sp. NCCP-2716]|uniref:phosphatidate cytidylyltransferase n=1 Tax=Sporosarcina sp. NCCP-2716 TaxID=2943679 RepID=UPI00203C62FA|nr:phosphatidate cytidylyltransferase [Sporosarcina sp. NCCP-2716]GKV67831.1 phosphatidate cytidylyltransferase [Sporosarcina sp. NCCP-2716]
MKQRILTAVIAAAVFIPFVITGGVPFTLLVYAIATIGLYELLKMQSIRLASAEGVLAWLMAAVFLLPKNTADRWLGAIGYTKLDAAFVIILLLLIYTVIVKNRFTFSDAAFSVLAAFYVGMGFYFLTATREAGLIFIIYALVVVWTTDSGAYFVGRKLGKTKLWPDISPNKTVEGFVGGIISAVIFVLIFQLIEPITSSYLILIGMTILASIVGQLGDLVESAFKRTYNVKDSGKLLPGHGGILDRFDSLLFVLPLLHLLHFVS